MKMTLEDAKYCISGSGNCKKCKFTDANHFVCREAALEIAESCINYCLVGKKLTSELESKER